jgi:hypothetical protein
MLPNKIFLFFLYYFSEAALTMLIDLRGFHVASLNAGRYPGTISTLWLIRAGRSIYHLKGSYLKK